MSTRDWILKPEYRCLLWVPSIRRAAGRQPSEQHSHRVPFAAVAELVQVVMDDTQTILDSVSNEELMGCGAVSDHIVRTSPLTLAVCPEAVGRSVVRSRGRGDKSQWLSSPHLTPSEKSSRRSCLQFVSQGRIRGHQTISRQAAKDRHHGGPHSSISPVDQVHHYEGCDDSAENNCRQ
jgi:hypothetical protein